MNRSFKLCILVSLCMFGRLSAVPVQQQQGSSYDEEIIVVPLSSESPDVIAVEEPDFSGDGSGYDDLGSGEVRADIATVEILDYEEASGEETLIDASSVEASGEETPVDASGVEASGEETPIDASGVEASGEETPIDASGVEPTRVEASGIDVSEYERADFEESSGESSGEALAEDQDIVLYDTYGDVEVVSRARRAAVNESDDSTTTKAAATTTKASPTVAKASSTTKSSASTTTAASTASTTEENSCKPHTTCFSDSECGGKGRCLGIFVGKCNCNACINLLTCEDDKACGGLNGACNGTTQRCNCIEGYQANGFPKFIDALRSLCNVKDCGRDTDSCFGLPCNSGRCVC